MNKIVRIPLFAASLLLMLAVGVSVVFAAPDPFVGGWESTDQDGSYQVLTIGGGPGNSYHVRYYDFGATICGLDPVTGDFLHAASAQGVLTDSGSGPEGTLPVYCRTSPPTFWGNANFNYMYDSITDTLVDAHGIVWSRK